MSDGQVDPTDGRIRFWWSELRKELPEHVPLLIAPVLVAYVIGIVWVTALPLVFVTLPITELTGFMFLNWWQRRARQLHIHGFRNRSERERRKQSPPAPDANVSWPEAFAFHGLCLSCAAMFAVGTGLLGLIIWSLIDAESFSLNQRMMAIVAEVVVMAATFLIFAYVRALVAPEGRFNLVPFRDISLVGNDAQHISQLWTPARTAKSAGRPFNSVIALAFCLALIPTAIAFAKSAGRTDSTEVRMGDGDQGKPQLISILCGGEARDALKRAGLKGRSVDLFVAYSTKLGCTMVRENLLLTEPANPHLMMTHFVSPEGRPTGTMIWNRETGVGVPLLASEDAVVAAVVGDANVVDVSELGSTEGTSIRVLTESNGDCRIAIQPNTDVPWDIIDTTESPALGAFFVAFGQVGRRDGGPDWYFDRPSSATVRVDRANGTTKLIPHGAATKAQTTAAETSRSCPSIETLKKLRGTAGHR